MNPHKTSTVNDLIHFLVNLLLGSRLIDGLNWLSTLISFDWSIKPIINLDWFCIVGPFQSIHLKSLRAFRDDVPVPHRMGICTRQSIFFFFIFWFFLKKNQEMNHTKTYFQDLTSWRDWWRSRTCAYGTTGAPWCQTTSAHGVTATQVTPNGPARQKRARS
jgi:hypothetical protein